MADPVRARRARGRLTELPALLEETREALRGWGGGPSSPALVVRPTDYDAVRAALARAPASRARAGPPGEGNGRPAATPRGVIARGMGRSYGDAAQLAHGLVLDMTRMKGFELDVAQGTVSAEAGVTVGELLGALVPAGWVVPVLPGTQHVSVGGAIASDIHGKNHGTLGTFGSHVRALGLLTAEGEVRELEPGSEDGLFEATMGGMGLTGVILWARFDVRPVSTSLLSVDTDRARDMDEALALLSAPGGPHRVAWIDLLGRRPGRGIVTRASHLAEAPQEPAGAGAATVRARATVPERWPAGLLRASSVAAFNELRFRLAPRHERGQVEGLARHMFPLDGLAAWPRLYGRAGFLQYQLVVPTGREQALYAVIERLRRSRVPCYLAVLKDFGAANQAPLSFPLAGWTLALDLPRAALGLHAALERCDELVAEAGGRVYLSKDSRLRAETVTAMYPRLAEWRAIRDRADPDGLWRSDLARRTGLVPADHR